MMKALILRHAEVEDSCILGHYLNKRGSDPESRPFQISIKYLESGVLHIYCNDGVLSKRGLTPSAFLNDSGNRSYKPRIRPRRRGLQVSAVPTLPSLRRSLRG